MKTFLSMFELMLLASLIGSCGYNNTEVPGGAPAGGGGGQNAELNFATVNSQIFQPHCIRCHGSSGGVTLTSYSSVFSILSRVQAAVNSGRMPPSGGLPQTSRNLLNQWVTAGAPENGLGTATGTTAAGTAGGAAGGTTGGDEDCEDDRRLLGTSVLVPVGARRVYDTEKAIIRNVSHGCDDR